MRIWLLLNLLATGWVPVQRLWGLEEFHSQRGKKNVTYQLQTWQKYIVYYAIYGNTEFWGQEVLSHNDHGGHYADGIHSYQFQSCYAGTSYM